MTDLRSADTVATTATALEASPPPYVISGGLAARLARRALTSPGAVAYDCVTPMTGGLLASLPQSTIENVEVAYRAAQAAQPRWAARSPHERARFLLRLHDLVLQHQDELLDLIQLESGKTRRHAFDEVLDVAGVCRHYARKGPGYLATKRRLGAIPLLSQARELRHPKGVVGVVAPWNYPLSMSITDALPALLAGNAVVLRPDNKSALTALRAVELIDQAGLPEGLLQVVLGDGPTVGNAVLERADYVMFTGSTATGRKVAAAAGERLIGASLELGGKNPMYVADDADLEGAAECAMRAMFSSAGQLCISIERLILHEKIADEFLGIFIPMVQQMKLGPELSWGNDMGSLISAEQLQRVTDHVEDAVSHGAKVLVGGRARPDLGPSFYEPTVLDGVTEEMTLCRQETFGPVVAVRRVAGDAEAVAMANDSEYGLNASVWTRDTARGRGIGNQIRCGTVNVNEGYAAAWASNGAPMGGMGQSGIGRRHGAEGIQKYTESQNVTVQYGPGFAIPKGVPPKTWARAMSVGMKLMKAGRLS
ncbi:succinic semialdehyde dehydrogenase [Yimella sp. cx-51]|uniref:succinic semialdehyde dehydrogenase n=1 Tax=Yimella sp. cx-51 TaxID=2770551 RepID=UPI00165E80F5|nr:succinic semialdehyde dehydrogenase [Yimella sp. cx-51]MBC9958244.1 succinate-semialdehyde dehydrogenase (NADP(+)) [Yimella sp. cx-51]MBD2758883.1 succinate-semialdehyde dehydrogenase (NADP(+)) [Yimella sp. cx-573]QTH38727.1 succinate-semialdehyde dehydrogenase (NADP(+)) [Yimella sp. cx-51]